MNNKYKFYNSIVITKDSIISLCLIVYFCSISILTFAETIFGLVIGQGIIGISRLLFISFAIFLTIIKKQGRVKLSI